jgi:hypothetical protein
MIFDVPCLVPDVLSGKGDKISAHAHVLYAEKVAKQAENAQNGYLWVWNLLPIPRNAFITAGTLNASAKLLE